MPTVIDSLVVTLGLDASKFTAQQKQAVASLKQFEDAANKHGKGAQKGIDDLVGSFKELQGRLLAIGALISAGLGFNRLVQDVTKANTELGQLSKTLQISGENLSAWDHVGRTVGAATNEMSQGIKKLDYELSKFRAGMGSDLMAWMGTVGVPGVANMRTGEDVIRGLNAYYNQQAAKGPQQAKDAAFQIQNFAGLSQAQLNAVMLSPQELEKRFAFGKKFAPTQDDIDKFTKLTQAFNDLLTVIDKITRDALTPFITKLTELLNGLTNWLGNTFGGNKNPAASGALGMDWLRPGGAGSAGSANDNTPTEGGSDFLKQQRQSFTEQLNDPGTRERVKAMAVLEGTPTQTIESLANRFGYVNEQRAKQGLPPLTVDQMLNSGFYGPINRGGLPGAVSQIRNNSELSRQMDAAVNRVTGGSNTISGYTDQGLPTDPNGWRLPQIRQGGNVFTDWNGGPGGAAASAAYRERLQQGVREEQERANQAKAWSGPRLRVTPESRGLSLPDTPSFNDLWNNRIGIGAKTSMLRGGNTMTNTNNSNTTTNIASMNVSVPPGADPSAYADGISRRLADYDNIQNANTGLV